MHGGELAGAVHPSHILAAAYALRTETGASMNPQKILICRAGIGCCIAVGAVVAAFAPSLLQAQQFNNRNIATFTAGQAAQGKTAYGKSCASCHGQNQMCIRDRRI